jgi:single-strand DNA-binding protein
MAKSLNRVQLIGNLTRDPELRYTPSGTAVCTFSIATNRSWTTDTGEKKDEVDFHRIVAWNKLAEICSQFLIKGRKAYVEGRLTTRSWTGQDGVQKQTTEIIISDMIILDSKRVEQPAISAEPEVSEEQEPVKVSKAGKVSKVSKEEEESAPSEEVVADDIPF